MPHVDTPQSRCYFGLASCDITPPPDIYHRLWGSATHDRATGVHRPLRATAMTFQALRDQGAGPTEQLVVALDHCILWDREMKQLIESVCAQAEVAPEQLVVTFSHTHSAGLMGLERLHLPGGDLIPEYLAELANRVGSVVRQARECARPASITYATSRCGLAAQRDFWDAVGGQYVCGFNPDGVADDIVLVARVTDDSNKTLAIIVNYACHPTTLAWQNTLISPDFPGAMREIVEQATHAQCIFLQGASGDLGPREQYVGNVAVADRNGRQLGYAVLTAVEGMPPPITRFEYTGPVVSGATLGTWAHVALDADQLRQKQLWRRHHWTVELPYRSGLTTTEELRAQQTQWQTEEQAALKANDLMKARDCRAMIERMTRWLTRTEVLPFGKTFPLPITLWQIGDAFWLAVEGEHYQMLQRALRARFSSVPIFVITLANGARPTYLPSADSYGKGIYQESIAVLAPGCLERLIETVGNEMDAWLGKV